MSASAPKLPIDDSLGAIQAAVDAHACVILQAPPGTGKTTRTAPALLRGMGGAASTQQIVLIQPRRIAARAAAARISEELDVPLGGLVGYQVRFDARRGANTRLVAMTPGILLRQLQSDSVLAEVAVVVLDEFHERSLEYDLLLGMLRRIQTELRPELKLVLMSATLDSRGLEEYLEQPPVIRIESQAYPVQIHYSRFVPPAPARGGRPISPSRRCVEQATQATLDATQQESGDVLVFLPGVGEISQVERNLQSHAERHNWALMSLYGDMTPQAQDRVLAPSSQRKVILATNVAETSLTIDGVRIVIDSGWSRVQRIDPAIGLNLLRLEPISKASADQRAGRAGRTAPGSCFRLWDEVTGRSRAEYLEPEVLRVDLTGAVLQLLCWGESDVTAFPWLTPPSQAAIDQALAALALLGAWSDGQVTPRGRLLNHLPVQPRLGRLLVEGHALRIPTAAAMAAALLSEREVFERYGRNPPVGGSAGQHACDVTQQVLALQAFADHGQMESAAGTIKIGAARHVLRVAQQLQRMVQDELGPTQDVALDEQLQQALLVAFPDRVAKRRAAGSPRGLMVGGRGVKLEGMSGVQHAELFLCLDVDAGGSEASVRKASGLQPEWLPLELLSERDERFFNPTLAAIVTRRRTFFLDLLLSETPVETPADEATALLLAQAAAERFERLLPPKDKALQSWLARVQWLANELPAERLPSDWPQFSVPALTEHIAGWCFGMRRLDEVKQLPWKNLLDGLVSPESRRLLDAQAPESYRLPSGRSVLLQYELGKPPVLAAKIQEFFGIHQTPRLAGGRVPLVLHLLAPNGRVQQITDDLASFWAHTYAVVRKELRGRYPKHAWPEDPHVADK